MFFRQTLLAQSVGIDPKNILVRFDTLDLLMLTYLLHIALPFLAYHHLTQKIWEIPSFLILFFFFCNSEHNVTFVSHFLKSCSYYLNIMTFNDTALQSLTGKYRGLQWRSWNSMEFIIGKTQSWKVHWRYFAASKKNQNK